MYHCQESGNLRNKSLYVADSAQEDEARTSDCRVIVCGFNLTEVQKIV